LESSRSELSFEPSFARIRGGSALPHQILAAMILGAKQWGRYVNDRKEKKDFRYPGKNIYRCNQEIRSAFSSCLVIIFKLQQISLWTWIFWVQKLEIFKFICSTAGPHDLIQSEIRRALGVFVWTITCVWWAGACCTWQGRLCREITCCSWKRSGHHCWWFFA
jgi:hypothetical protein